MAALMSGAIAIPAALFAAGFARLPPGADGLFEGEVSGPGGVLLRAAATLRTRPDRMAILIGLAAGAGTMITMAVAVAPLPAGIAVGLLGVVAAADFRCGLLPESLLPLAAIAAAWAAQIAGTAQPALLSATAAAALGALIPAFRPGRIGMGDIPYLVIASLLVPPMLLFFWLIAIGLLQAAAIRVSGETTLPFTPVIWLMTVGAMILVRFFPAMGV